MYDTILVEACVTSLEEAIAAESAGAHRLELCINLEVGGLTPPADLLDAVQAQVGIPVQVLVRCRAGDFIYSEEEVTAMCRSARDAVQGGASGIVFGALTPAGIIDASAMADILAASGQRGVTMHRAFDDARDAMEALETCRAVGIERILTSGHAPSASEGTHVLAALIAAAGDDITIMPGGTVRAHNVMALLEATGALEIHARASAVREIIAAIRSGRRA